MNAPVWVIFRFSISMATSCESTLVVSSHVAYFVNTMNLPVTLMDMVQSVKRLILCPLLAPTRAGLSVFYSYRAGNDLGHRS